VTIEVLADIPGQALERKFPDQEIRTLLVFADLAERLGTGSVPVRSELCVRRHGSHRRRTSSAFASTSADACASASASGNRSWLGAEHPFPGPASAPANPASSSSGVPLHQCLALQNQRQGRVHLRVLCVPSLCRCCCRYRLHCHALVGIVERHTLRLTEWYTPQASRCSAS